ncbi:MAG: hypothetical protein R3F49_16545 [Planctomycetota bacterium]
MFAALLLMLCPALHAPGPPPAAPISAEPVSVPQSDARGALETFVVDAHGELLVDGWTLEAVPIAPWNLALQDAAVSTRSARALAATTSIDPQRGVGRMRALAAGLYRVQARHTTGERTEAVQVEVHAGAVTSCALHLDGPAPRKNLYVNIGGRYAFEDVRLVARSGHGPPIALERRRGSTFWARDVDAGVYTVSIEDPRFKPSELRGLARGAVGSLTVVGSASLIVVLRDASDGRALRASDASVTQVHADGRQTVTRMQRALAPDELVAADLSPSAARVRVTFAERPPFELEVQELAPGEPQRVVARAPRGADLEVRVHGAEACLLAGLAVTVQPRGPDGRALSRSGPVSQRALRGAPNPTALGPEAGALDGRVGTTDERGLCALRGFAPGPHEVRMYLTPWTSEARHWDVPPTLPPSDQAASALDFALPQGCGADLWFQLAADSGGNGGSGGAGDAEGTGSLDARLRAYDGALQINGAPWQRFAHASGPLVDERGRMALRGLRPGPCTLVITAPSPEPALPGDRERRRTLRVEFTAAPGPPTQVRVDLRSSSEAP